MNRRENTAVFLRRHATSIMLTTCTLTVAGVAVYAIREIKLTDQVALEALERAHSKSRQFSSLFNAVKDGHEIFFDGDRLVDLTKHNQHVADVAKRVAASKL